MSNAFDHPERPALSNRKKQYLLLGGIAASIIIVLWVVIVMFSPKTEKKDPALTAKPNQPKNTSGPVMAPGSQLDRRDEWLGSAARDVQTIRSQTNDQGQRVDRAEMRVKQLEDKIAQLSKAQSQNPATTDSSSQPAGAQTFPGFTPASQGPVNTPIKSTAPVTNMPRGVPPGVRGVKEQPQEKAFSTGLVRVSMDDPSSTSGANSSVVGTPAPTGVRPVPPTTSQKPSVEQVSENYMPIGFAPGVLLTGLDAPTSGQGQKNPMPVLIRMEDNAFLPNRYRADTKECFGIASSYGDLSSERAFMRLETMSCVRSDGRVLEISANGSVFDSDGKVGIRGRLVSKQGAVIANALLAGFASGVGSSFSRSQGTVFSSPLGTSTTQGFGDALKAGVGEGFSSAADKVSDYFIKLADRMHPIIEVDAGRRIDVVFTKGIRIDQFVGSVASNRAGPVLKSSFFEGHPDD